MGDGAVEAMVALELPADLLVRAESGVALFAARCASCHGENGAGTSGVGPPLIHRIYEPSYHGDEAIQRAVAHGVPAHHWSFGDMPPVEGMTRGDVAMVVACIREVRRANGIR